MRIQWISVICAASLVACASTPNAATNSVSTAGVLELGEITIFEGANAVFKIHADGTTEMGSHKGSLALESGKTASSDSLPIVWEAGPVFHADGTIDSKGASVAKVTSNGTVLELASGATMPFSITGNKIKVTAPNSAPMTAELGADGKITMLDAPVDVHVDGASTPGKVRTVLVVLGLVFAPGEVRSGAVMSGPQQQDNVPPITK